MKRLFAGLALAIFTSAFTAQATPYFQQPLDNDCGRVEGAHPYDYCITRTPGSRNSDVVYQLHGSGGSARTWIDDPHGHNMRQWWSDNGKDAPTVVTISFGRWWLLVGKNGAPKSGLGDFFFNEVIPHVEKNLIGGRIGARKLFGISMGGFNGAMLMLEHPRAFTAVVLACPAVNRLSPYADQREIDGLAARTGGNANSVRNVVKMTAPFFPDTKTWNERAPIGLAERSMTPNHPALHVSCGDRDELGIHESSKELADIARSKGVKTEWLSLQGGHCVMDTDSMAAFLVEN